MPEPVTVISVESKLVVASLEVKVNAMLASFVVAPFVTPLVVDVISMVGPALSYVQVNWGADKLLFPYASVNVD